MHMATNNSYLTQYKKSLQDYLGVNEVYLFWKARVALYGLLKAMDVKAGDEVIIPAYTCVVVPNAVIYLGAKPVYVDIDLSTFNANYELIEQAITEKTKVIICQNTYGLSSSTDKIAKLAKDKGLFSIEDCTHGFGGTFEGVQNGLTCDAAIYSTQWNKPFSTGVGGFAICKADTVKNKLDQFEQGLTKPSKKDQFTLTALIFARKYFLNKTTYWQLLKLYRWLSSKNLVIGSSSAEEIDSIEIPDSYFQGAAAIQAKTGIKNLKDLDKLLSMRKASARKFTDFLKKEGKNHVNDGLFSNHSFLKYPLLVKDRQQFMKLAEKRKISLGDWFTSPLHPVSTNLSLWHFESKKYPNGIRAANEVVNLPTDVTGIELERVLTFLSEHSDLICKDLNT